MGSFANFTIGGISLIVFSIIVNVLIVFFLVNYQKNIRRYQTIKAMLYLSIYPYVFGMIVIIVVLYNEYNAIFYERWPGPFWYIVITGYVILIGDILLLIAYFGKLWLLRLNYRFKHNWGPYLVQTAEPHHSVKIIWKGKLKKGEKPIELIGVKDYKTQICNIQDKKASWVRGLRQAIISGLEPDTEYEYTIRRSKSLLSFLLDSSNYETETYNFHTLKEPFLARKNQKETNISFLVIGDMHAGGHNVGPLISIIKNHHKEVDFIITLGDIVSDSRYIAHFKTYFGQMRNIVSQIPMYYCTGNHDGFTKSGYYNLTTIFPQPYVDRETGGYFSQIISNNLFVFLDVYNAGTNFEKINKEQEKWLESEISEASKNPNIINIFLFMHNQPFARIEKEIHPDLGPILEPMIERHKKIKVVFGGHYHSFKTNVKDYGDHSTFYIVTGGGGGKTSYGMSKYLGKHNPYLYEKEHKRIKHFMRIDLNIKDTNDYQTISMTAFDWKNNVLWYNVIGD
ncbi:MAG: hypothetical protein GF364_21955 [Candidatus Lokiarchaeota archaeon]|nr:hypothetical protein [Candidatus Lokiarchaeota archaeon]